MAIRKHNFSDILNKATADTPFDRTIFVEQTDEVTTSEQDISIDFFPRKYVEEYAQLAADQPKLPTKYDESWLEGDAYDFNTCHPFRDVSIPEGKTLQDYATIEEALKDVIIIMPYAHDSCTPGIHHRQIMFWVNKLLTWPVGVRRVRSYTDCFKNATNPKDKLMPGYVKSTKHLQGIADNTFRYLKRHDSKYYDYYPLGARYTSWEDGVNWEAFITGIEDETLRAGSIGGIIHSFALDLYSYNIPDADNWLRDSLKVLPAIDYSYHHASASTNSMTPNSIIQSTASKLALAAFCLLYSENGRILSESDFRLLTEAFERAMSGEDVKHYGEMGKAHGMQWLRANEPKHALVRSQVPTVANEPDPTQPTAGLADDPLD